MVGLMAWVVPGAGHLWLGRLSKGCIFFVALSAMFSIGLMLEGELFEIEPSQPLVALAALADLGIGLPYFIAQIFGFGAGRVVATTYEYGNSFLIVSGLLNMLVVGSQVSCKLVTNAQPFSIDDSLCGVCITDFCGFDE